KVACGRVDPNGGLDVIRYVGPGEAGHVRRGWAHPVVDEPKVLREVHPSRQGCRRADRERELPRVSLESIRRCVVDDERIGQWERVCVGGVFRITYEIERRGVQ